MTKRPLEVKVVKYPNASNSLEILRSNLESGPKSTPLFPDSTFVRESNDARKVDPVRKSNATRKVDPTSESTTTTRVDLVCELHSGKVDPVGEFNSEIIEKEKLLTLELMVQPKLSRNNEDFLSKIEFSRAMYDQNINILNSAYNGELKMLEDMYSPQLLKIHESLSDENMTLVRMNQLIMKRENLMKQWYVRKGFYKNRRDLRLTEYQKSWTEISNVKIATWEENRSSILKELDDKI